MTRTPMRFSNLSEQKRQLLSLLLKHHGLNEHEVQQGPILLRPLNVSDLPLSYFQRSLWFLAQIAPASPFYNISSAVRIFGHLDIRALQQAFDEIVRRHEILRTTFPAVDGKPRQLIAAEQRLELSLIEAPHMSRPQRDEHLLAQATSESLRPFDLATGPLLRTVLYRLDTAEHILLITVHHIVSDGWSISVLAGELGALYAAFRAGEPDPLPALPIQYADYALWQRDKLQGEHLENQLAYWRAQLDDVPVLNLPTDHPRPALQQFRGDVEYVALPRTLSDALEALAQSQGVTLFMVLLAAFKVLLQRYSDQSAIVIGTTIANRNRRETEGLIGFFANSLVLATDLAGNPLFTELLQRVKIVTLGAYAHQDIPFEMLVEKLNIERDPSRNPLFQIMFTLQHTSIDDLRLMDLQVYPQPLPNDTTHFDMEFHLWDRGGDLGGYISYNTDLFGAATIVRLLDHYQQLLEAIVADPERCIADLPPLKPRLRQYSPDLRNIEAALLRHPALDACRVLWQRTDTGGERMIAYYAAAKPPPSAELQAHLLALLPEAVLPEWFIPVSRLPLNKSGAIDEAALAALPAADEAAIERWETRLQALPGIDRVKVIGQPYSPPAKSLHIADLLPDWHHPKAQQGCTSQESASAMPQTTGAPALANGGPLTIPENAPQTLSDALIRAAALDHNRGIVFVEATGAERYLSYAELLQKSLGILGVLHGQGLQHGDRVVIQFDTLYDHICAFWACVLGSIVPVTVAIAPSYEQKNGVINKLWNAWKLLEHPVVLCSPALQSSLKRLPCLYPEDSSAQFQVLALDTEHVSAPPAEPYPSQPDDLVFFQLTSGSTGVPKCVQETHHGIIHHIQGARCFNNYADKEIGLNWLPMDHVVPTLTSHLKDVYLGFRQILVKTSLILSDPLLWLDLLDAHRVTLSWAPNFAFKLVNDRLAKEPPRGWNLSRVKRIMNAGEQVTLPVARDFVARLAPFGLAPQVMQPAYGMAEVCTAVTYGNDFNCERSAHTVLKTSLGGVLQETDKHSADTITFVEVGPPIPGVQIRICDTTNRMLNEGMIGRVQIKGAVTTPAYLNNEEANREAFVGDGWFNTGDLGFLRNGRLCITGREKETIIVRGANFYCYEIEDVVNSIAGVKPTFAAACAVDDADTGTEGLAVFFVAQHCKPPIDAALIQTVRNTIASELGVSPSYVLPLLEGEFPKTTSGKIQRTQLKKNLAAGCFDSLIKQVELELHNTNTLPDWFFRPVWRRQDAMLLSPTSPVALPEEPALVFADTDSAALAAALSETAAQVSIARDFEQIDSYHYRINPARPEHYQRLLAALASHGLSPRCVYHLWSYGPAEDIVDPAALNDAQNRGVHSLLCLIQALSADNRDGDPIRLLVVSSHSQQVRVDDTLAIERAPLKGLIKTVSQEIAWLDCRHIDLPPGDHTANADLILGESRAIAKDRDIAYRDGRRWVLDLEKAEFRKPTPLPFKHGGIYLISGGLGGLGRRIARFLLTHFASRLILIGRSPLSEEGEQALAALQKLPGEVFYETADCSDMAQMQAIIGRAEVRWNADLDGILHLAGVYRTRLLNEESVESFAAAVNAKLVGGWVLHRLVQQREHALFISFSSVNGFLGGIAAGAYAAANAFLETLALHQRRCGLQSYCFAWSMWDEVGMSGGYPMKDQARTQGYYIVDPDKGMNAFHAGLHGDHPQLLIGLDAANPHIRRYVRGSFYPTRRWVAYHSTRSNTDLPVAPETPPGCELARLPELPLTADGEVDTAQLSGLNLARRTGPERIAPRNKLERTIAAIWREVLEVEAPGIHDSFFELGGQSLLLVQVQSKLQQALNHEIAVVDLLRYPTIGALAAFLGERSQPSGETVQNARERAAKQRAKRTIRNRPQRRQLR